VILLTGCLALQGRPDHLIDVDEDGFLEVDDCDDNDPTVFPGADEFCDGRQTDCSVIWDEDAGLASIHQDGAWYDATGWMEGDGVLLDGDLELHICEGTWRGKIRATAGDQLVVGREAVLTGSARDVVAVQEGPGTLTLSQVTVAGGGGCLGSTLRVGHGTNCDAGAVSAVTGTMVLSGVTVEGGRERGLGTALVAGGSLELRDGTTMGDSESDAVWLIDGELRCSGSTVGGYAGTGVRVFGDYDATSSDCAWDDPAVSDTDEVLWTEGDFSCDAAGCD